MRELAFNVLIDTLKSVKDESLMFTAKRYTLNGFPVALHWWFLASVPTIEKIFADVGNSDGFFLCERYSKTELPNFRKIVEIESSGYVEVVCVIRRSVFLPALVGEYSGSLKSLIELVGRGYRLTISDWLSKSIDLVEANEVIARQNLRFGSFSSTEERNDEVKILMAKFLSLEEEVKILKAKVLPLEEEVKLLKAKVLQPSLQLENEVNVID